MSEHPTKLDMLAFARSMVPAQYRGKGNWDKILKCFSKPFQDLENGFWQLLTERYLSVAVGDVLDQLGEIVVEPREGRTDEAYRVAIRVKILIVVSSGTQPQILAILATLMPTVSHLFVPYYPAAFTVEAGGVVTAVQAAELARAVRRAKAAGVGAQVISSQVDEANSFLWSDDTEIASSTQGFADDEETDAGGALADVQE
jgi:hypothetical protein